MQQIMNAKENNLPELEAIFVKGCPNITTPESAEKQITEEIFVADLPILTDDIQEEKEGAVDEEAADARSTPSETIDPNDSFSNNASIDSDEEYFNEKEVDISEKSTTKKTTKKRVRKKPLRKCDVITEEPKFMCNICTTGFQRKSSYTRHMKKQHNIIKDPTPHACPNCPRKYEYEYELKRHMKKYKPLKERLIFSCTQCKRKFQTRVHLNRHIQHVHEDARSFVCEECGQAVHTSTKLKEHMLVHTDHSPYQCMECGKAFKQKERLKRHMATHVEKYVCGQCGKSLSTRFNLTKHLLVHDQAKLYKCDLCGSGFRLMTTLKVHLNMHSGHKVYECDFCDKIFAVSFSRLKHTKKMHPEQLAEQEAITATKSVANALRIYDTLTHFADNCVGGMRELARYGRSPERTPENFGVEDFEMHHNMQDFTPNTYEQSVSRTLYNINSTVF